jgi:hypothetical protein
LASAFYWLKGDPSLELSSTLTDDDVKNAQIEAALFLMGHSDELDETRAFLGMGGEEFVLSKREQVFDPSNFSIPRHILGLLSTYQISNTTIQLAGHYDE